MSSTTPFGNGRGAGDANTLYFTAGIPGPGNIEDHGLFGSIQVADSSTAPKAQASPVNIINFAFAPPTITSRGDFPYSVGDLNWTCSTCPTRPAQRSVIA
jgi:hypothetical protein